MCQRSPTVTSESHQRTHGLAHRLKPCDIAESLRMAGSSRRLAAAARAPRPAQGDAIISQFALRGVLLGRPRPSVTVRSSGPACNACGRRSEAVASPVVHPGRARCTRAAAIAGALMLNVFTLANGRLFQEEIESPDALAHVQPVWVDLDAPTRRGKGLDRAALRPDDPAGRRRRRPRGVGALLRGRQRRAAHPLRLPDRRRPSTARNVRVAFILFKNVLFSVHGEDLPVFRLLRLRARRIPALIEDAKDVLLKLYDADAEYSRRCARGHLRQPGGGQRARAQAGRQRPGGRRGAGRDRQAKRT